MHRVIVIFDGFELMFWPPEKDFIFFGIIPDSEAKSSGFFGDFQIIFGCFVNI